MFSSIRQKKFFLITCFHLCIRKGIWWYGICKSVQNNVEITSNIVMSKPRVAPLKSNNINIGVVWSSSWTEVSKINCKCLKDELERSHLVDRRYERFVLDPKQSWLFKCFVVNRVRITQTQTELSQWRYALTKCIPENRIIFGSVVQSFLELLKMNDKSVRHQQTKKKRVLVRNPEMIAIMLWWRLKSLKKLAIKIDIRKTR